MTPEEIQEKLADIASLSVEDLSALEAELVSSIETAAADDTDESLELMAIGAEALDTVRGEITTRETAAAERETKRQEILSKVRPVEDEVVEEVEVEDPAPVEVIADPEPEVVTEAPEPVAVAAAATPKKPAVKPRNKVNPATLTKTPKKSAAIMAASTLRTVQKQIPVGTDMQDLRVLGEAVAFAIDHGRKGASGFTPIASFEFEYPEDRILGGDPFENQAKIDAVTSPDAITAAGGLCAPVAAYYELANISMASRPIRDSLPGFAGARRGGIRFIEPPSLASITGPGLGATSAIDVITAAEDAESATKPCLTITCGTEVEVLTQAISLCLQVGNFSRITFPEQFAAWWALGQAAHARVAENTLWDRMCTLSTSVSTGTEVLGTVREFFPAIHRLVAGLKSRHRMSEDSNLHLWAPMWLRYNMIVDLVRQMPGDDAIARADAIVNAAFRDLRVNVTWSPDAGGQIFGTQAAGAAVPWPSTVEVILAPEGTFLFLDTGRLDFGLEIRDSTLNAANNSRAMFETFENVADVGVEAICTSIDICPDGSAAALQDTEAYCGSGS